MKNLFAVLSLLCVMVSTLQAQDYVNAVWVLDEGLLDWQTGEMVDPAGVGVYNVEAETFTSIMTFPEASFTSNIIIADGAAYVGADNKIYKIDLNTFAVDAEVEVSGVRQLAYHDGLVYMTRGDVDDVTWASVEFESYLLWFDAETLSPVGELLASEGVGYASEGIEIVDGVVYVAINNGFSWGQEVGILGVYDIESGTYTEHDLGEDGKNPAHIKVTESEVIMVNNTNWEATSLSRIELPSLGAQVATVTTIYVDGVSAGCNAASLMGENLVFQVSGEMGMRMASVNDLSPSSDTWGPATDVFYRMAVNPINGDVYGAVTNFSDFAEVQILDVNGNFLSSFDAGVVPGGIAFDVREVVSVGYVINEDGLDRSVIGEFDLMGRVWSERSIGMKIERLESGELRKTWVVQ
jgi:hypothetical protein